jgi:hypothetical protein
MHNVVKIALIGSGPYMKKLYYAIEQYGYDTNFSMVRR